MASAANFVLKAYKTESNARADTNPLAVNSLSESRKENFMAIETEAMRLQYLKDFGVSDVTYRDTSAGTTAMIYTLLREEYFGEQAVGEVDV